jgi:hypothetical protein
MFLPLVLSPKSSLKLRLQKLLLLRKNRLQMLEATLQHLRTAPQKTRAEMTP